MGKKKKAGEKAGRMGKKKQQQNNQERCPSSYMYWGGHIKTRLTELDQNNGSGAHLYHVQICFKMILKENAKGVWYNVQLRNGIKETLAKYENYKKIITLVKIKNNMKPGFMNNMKPDFWILAMDQYRHLILIL